jgi:hypothetical protein
MVRIIWLALAGVVLALASPLVAADAAPPAGNWKFAFLNQGRMVTLWIVKLEQKDGKWAGEVIATQEGAPPASAVEKLAIDGDKVAFSLVIQKQPFSFEGRIPKEAGKKVLGSLALGNQMVPAELEPTKLKTLDSYEVSKEAINTASGPELFSAALELIRQADDKKAKPEEVSAWATKAFTAAEPYGARWQREIAMRISTSLVNQEGFIPVALEYARKAKRLTDPSDDFTSQMRVLNVLASALTKSKKEDEAKEVEKEADAIYLKKMPPFKPEKYEGRKKKSDRTALVELFTGAQCPPCVAADLAFDALAKTYAPKDVVLLEYHLHIPGPDPLTNEDTVARSKYYDDEIEGTPTILFNGKLKPKVGGGGGPDASKGKYEEYRGAIDPILETEAGIKLSAKAARKGDKIDVSAEASGGKGDKLRLRMVIVEDLVRYTGSNQVRFHHHVVRAMPGGVEGVALKEGAGKQELTVDLGHIRETLNKYLNEYGKKQAFPNANRPMDMKDLYLVAFVQNDETKEIVQAVQVKVE